MMAKRLPYDPQVALQHLKKSDSVLAGLIVEVGAFGLQLKLEQTPFEALLRAIVYQQLSGRAAGSILNRVLELYDGEFPKPDELLATSDERLRTCGLSRAKVKAVQDLAEKTKQGELPVPDEIDAMDDAAIIDAYSKVRGIGPWTVEMLLIFNLGRPDVLPATDLGIRRGYSVIFATDELPSPSALLAHGVIWKPYRSVASWYLWQAANPGFRVKK